MNSWDVANQDWFENFQLDGEGHIIGRMVQSRHDGIFSEGALTGLGTLYDTDFVDGNDYPKVQYFAYGNNINLEYYSTYDSQIGGQGILYSILDKLITINPVNKLFLFHILSSLLSALVISAIILWFYKEFGFLSSIFVLVSTIFSQWLVVFGRNLWWSIWAFYLPMLAVMYYLKYNKLSTNSRFFKFGILIFVFIFIKYFFNGYEYITTTVLMMLVPLIYYSILETIHFLKFFKYMFIASICTVLAIVLSFSILCIQIMVVKGDIMKGINHITSSFQKRSYADSTKFDPIFEKSLKSSMGNVISTYLKDTFLDLNNYVSISNNFVSYWIFRIRFWYLIVLFLLMSFILYFNRRIFETTNLQRRSVALIYATWFSILAPLSWFIIFKAHSYIHKHMNPIVWHMPFTLFGFALCGLAIKSIFFKLKQKKLPN